MPASDAGVFSSAIHLPFFCTATWPPAPQMKLTIPLVKLLGAPSPNVPGYLSGWFQLRLPDATNRSGTRLVLRKSSTPVCVGVPSPFRMAKTLSCSTSSRTTCWVVAGL